MPSTTGSTRGASDTTPVPLRPILDDAAYEQALREVERLWDAAAGSPEDDQLQVLVLLIEAYERDHAPIPPPDPIDAIRFRMEQRNLTAADLAALLGVEERRVRGILQGRPLSLQMVRLLADHLGIPADVLIRRPPGAARQRARSV